MVLFGVNSDLGGQAPGSVFKLGHSGSEASGQVTLHPETGFPHLPYGHLQNHANFYTDHPWWHTEGDSFLTETVGRGHGLPQQRKVEFREVKPRIQISKSLVSNWRDFLPSSLFLFLG